MKLTDLSAGQAILLELALEPWRKRGAPFPGYPALERRTGIAREVLAEVCATMDAHAVPQVRREPSQEDEEKLAAHTAELARRKAIPGPPRREWKLRHG
jgi:hypothetical protein